MVGEDGSKLAEGSQEGERVVRKVKSRGGDEKTLKR
jgi:hypothetical protein